jgi:hypothetical protein
MTPLCARLIAAGVVLVAFAPTARADIIDRALVKNSAAIMEKVRGLKPADAPLNVAVLKFEVKVGNRPATFDAGPANAKLAQKLENLLVLANVPKNNVFVLADAGPAAAAAAQKTGAAFTWRDDARRAEFFRLPALPLAWDDTQKLEPNAFVTGTLELSQDLAETKVTLVGFTRAAPEKLETLMTVTGSAKDETARPIRTDRSVLALVGLGFSLGAKAVANGRQSDTIALKQVSGLLGRPEQVFATAAGECPVKLEVLVNGNAVPVEPGDDGAGKVVWPAGGVKPTDAVEFRLTNTSDKRYAVLLAVNGKNTNAQDKEDDLNVRDARDQRKWVLEPKEPTRVRGFYADRSGKYQPFEVLSAGEAEQVFDQMQARYRGRFTLYVYAERPDKPPVEAAAAPGAPVTADVKPAEEVKEEVEAAVLTLGWGNGGLEKVRSAGSLEKAQEELRKRTHAATVNGQLVLDPVKDDEYRRRGLIVKSEQTKNDGAIEQVEFRMSPQPVASLDIRYFQPKR